MPTYAYACTVCEHRFEAHQSFTDASLTVCPECAGRLRKIFPTVGVVFKGSGFYRNDSRSGGGKVPVGATSGQGDSHGEGSSSDSGDSAKTGAATKPGTPADAGGASSGPAKAAGAAATTSSGTSKSSGSGKAAGPTRSGSTKVGASSGSPAAG